MTTQGQNPHPEPCLRLFLGAGGSKPRVDAVLDGSCKVSGFLALPKGQSAYALAINPSRTALAVGTKGGMMHVVEIPSAESDGKPTSSACLRQGAAVLSVHFATDSILVASDVAGRCLLWRTDITDLPTGALEMPANGVVCSLLAPASDVLYGLTSVGELLEWRLPEGQLLASTPVPRPPAMGGLVQLLFWPAENALVYGAKGGGLVLFDLGKRNMRILQAHEADFYALAFLDNNLITAGMSEGDLRIWSPGEDRPCEVIHAPKGIVGIAQVPGGEHRLLLVDNDGAASIAILSEGHLRVESRLPGEDYRTILKPVHPQAECQAVSTVDTTQTIEGIEELTEKKIEALVQNRESMDLSERCSRLDAMGYGHVAIELRAKEAESIDDIPTALRLRSELLTMLPLDRTESGPILLGHASLLARIGLFDAARDVLKRLESICPSMADEEQEIRIVREYDRGNGNVPLIHHLQVPLRTAIESATGLDIPFTNRIVLNEGSPIRTRGVSISAEEIISKLEQIGLEAPERQVPTAIHEEIILSTNQGIAKRQLVTSEIPPIENVCGLQMAFQIVPDGPNACLVPITLFDTAKTPPDLPARAHNACVLESFERLQNEAQVWSARFSRVDNEIRKAINRIINAKLAERRY